MSLFPPTIVVRHKKENLKKCSLRGLESREDFQFFTYPKCELPSLEGYVMLTLDAPPLCEEDLHRGLFVLDGTWRYADKMAEQLGPFDGMIPRSIPGHFRTAYPRRQEGCSDPERGLASIEAIYLAYRLMGRERVLTEELLANYYWREQFLQINGLV
jgi:pre-rRNA-processing protein TSR3